MKPMRIMVLGGLAGVVLLSVPLAAQDARQRTQQAEADRTAEAERVAGACYDAIVKAYMNGQWDGLDEELGKYSRHSLRMTPQQRKDVLYIRKTAPEYRPSWWKACKSTSKTSFRAKTWGRPMTAWYEPAEKPSWTGTDKSGRIVMTLSWDPDLVDNTDRAGGSLAEIHGFTRGNMGEVLVWRHLGYVFMTDRLPLKQVIELHKGHKMLFEHLQEFYALMTSMYHCSPKARLAAMMMQLDALRGKSYVADRRGTAAVGALVLAHMLAEPTKWPNVRFPPEPLAKEVELSTIIHVYERIKPEWSLAEDRALREMIGTFFRKNAENVLRRKGEVPLPNKLSVKLMAVADRELQAKRDAWVTAQLAKVPEAQKGPTPGAEEKKAEETHKGKKKHK